jgi:hypothetical protein
LRVRIVARRRCWRGWWRGRGCGEVAR